VGTLTGATVRRIIKHEGNVAEAAVELAQKIMQ